MDEVSYHRFSPQNPESHRTVIQITTTEEKWTARMHIWQPPTDVYETADAFVVRIEIAGMQEAEFLVSLEGRTLAVQGVRSVTNKARAYYRMEISSGEFLSVVDLPGAIDVEHTRAEYEDGFLTITLPKARPSQVGVSD